jgi:hypothetical protein
MKQKNIKHNNHWSIQLKTFCAEQLWIILLLAPLIVIAILVSQHVLSSKSHQVITNNSRSFIGASAEVSSAQLAMIVAKPLSELIKMDVYFNSATKISSRGRMASVNSKARSTNHDYNKIGSDKNHLLSVKSQLNNKKDG